MNKKTLSSKIVLFSVLYLTSVIFISQSSPSHAQYNNPVRSQTEERLDVRTEKYERLQKKLEAFQDATRSQKIERINSMMITVNQNRVKAYEMYVERLQNILDRVVLATNTLSQSGIDTSSVELKIVSAEAALEDAHAALNTQLESDYTLIIESEETAKEDTMQMRTKLGIDLKSVLEIIRVAHQAIRDAHSELLNVQRSSSSSTSSTTE